MHKIELEFESEMEILDWAKDRSNNIAASLVLWEFDNYLRDLEKYTDEKDWPNVEKIRERLFEIFDEYDYEHNM